MQRLSKNRLEEMNGVLLDMCLDLGGAQYTEQMLMALGFSRKELEAVGFGEIGQ